MYIHIKPEPPKTFVIHIEVLTTDHNIHRVSISNMYKDESKVSACALSGNRSSAGCRGRGRWPRLQAAPTLTLLPCHLLSSNPQRKGSSVHLPFNNPPAKWCCLAVDVPETLRSVTSSQFCCVKSVQVCASVSVRGVYTSDQKYSVQASNTPTYTPNPETPRDVGNVRHYGSPPRPLDNSVSPQAAARPRWPCSPPAHHPFSSLCPRSPSSPHHRPLPSLPQDMPRDMGVSQVLPASQIPMIWMPAEPSGALDDEDLK